MVERVPAGDDRSPEALVVHKSRGPSIVWLVPIVALLIGGWVSYKSFAERGVRIEITFATADGLEAGKTKIKYKNVEVGVVDTIVIGADLTGVIVGATVERDAAPHLTEGTRFWVVRPRVGPGGISGLGTLFSGAYIEVEPGSGDPTREYRGLEQPPILGTDAPGRRFVLESDSLGSLTPGSPIFFRGIRAGEVLAYELREEDRSVEFDVFVDAPYDELVHTTTQFWNASGIEVAMGADGLRVRTESLESLLRGGIAFESSGKPEGLARAEAGTRFRLHRNHEDIDRHFGETMRYVLYFDGSVRGLSAGAPVDFRGIQIGTVIDVGLELEAESLELRIPVEIEVEPDRIRGIATGDPAPVEGLLDALVERGLRAQLQTGSLLTGQLFVEMELHPDSPIRLRDGKHPYPELPTMPTTLEELESSVAEVLSNLAELPLQELVREATTTLEKIGNMTDSAEVRELLDTGTMTLTDVRDFVRVLGKDLSPLISNVEETSLAARTVFHRAETTLGHLEESLGPDSTVQYDLASAMEEIAGAARAVRVLAAYLERNPDALVFGKHRSGGRK